MCTLSPKFFARVALLPSAHLRLRPEIKTSSLITFLGPRRLRDLHSQPGIRVQSGSNQVMPFLLENQPSLLANQREPILGQNRLLERGRGQNRKKLHVFGSTAAILVQDLAEKSGSDLGPIRGVLLNLWCNSGYLCRHIFNQLRALSPLSRQRSRVRVSSSPPDILEPESYELRGFLK